MSDHSLLILAFGAIEALTHAAVLHQRIVLDDAMEALIEEATRLVVGYLGVA